MTDQNKLSVRFFIIAGIIAVSVLMLSATSFSLEIKVKDSSKIDKNSVCLGDIATFEPADDIRVDRLKTIEISESPSPGTSGRINRELILYRISHIINAYQDITLSIPESMIAERTAQVVKGQTIEKIYNDYVINNSPWERDQIIFEKINVPESIALPEGRLDWEIVEKQNDNFQGSFTILIDFRVNGDSQRKILVSGKIGVMRDVVKAARNINSGEIISAKDIILVSEKGKYFKKSIITNKDDVIGKRSTRRIQADQMIQNGMFEVPPAIEKGARIMIKAESAELLITASGKALEEGCVGDRIRVMNESSGREIIATVKRTDLVEVRF